MLRSPRHERRHAAGWPTGVDIAVAGGRIAAIAPAATPRPAASSTPPAAWSRRPSSIRISTWTRRSPTACRASTQSGTLLEGIALWGELKPLLTHEAVMRAGARLLRLGGVAGPARHPQPCRHLRRPPARRRCAARGQAAASRPISTCSSSPSRRTAITARRRRATTSTRALDRGVDVVGGIPHFERTMADGAASVRRALRDRRRARPDASTCIATRPTTRSRAISRRSPTRRSASGLQGRVTGSHLTSMHSMDNYYVSKLLPLIAEAGVAAIANPLINIMLQGRHDTYPKRRGMTRVPEMLPGRHPRRLRPGLRDGPLVSARQRPTCSTSPYGPACRPDDEPAEAMRHCFDAVTVNAAHHGPRRLRPRRRLRRRASCCCRRATRSRRSGSGGAARGGPARQGHRRERAAGRGFRSPGGQRRSIRRATRRAFRARGAPRAQSGRRERS